MDNLSPLPVDVYPLIFKHLRGKTLFYVAQSSHYFWDIIYRYVKHVQLMKLEIYVIRIGFSSSYISFGFDISWKTNVDLSKDPKRRERAYNLINGRLYQLESRRKTKDISIFFMPTLHPMFDKILLKRLFTL